MTQNCCHEKGSIAPPTWAPHPATDSYTCMPKTHVKFLAFLNQFQPTVRLLLNFTTPNKCVCAHAVYACVPVCVLVCLCVDFQSKKLSPPLHTPSQLPKFSFFLSFFARKLFANFAVFEVDMLPLDATLNKSSSSSSSWCLIMMMMMVVVAVGGGVFPT